MPGVQARRSRDFNTGLCGGDQGIIQAKRQFDLNKVTQARTSCCCSAQSDVRFALSFRAPFLNFRNCCSRVTFRGTPWPSSAIHVYFATCGASRWRTRTAALPSFKSRARGSGTPRSFLRLRPSQLHFRSLFASSACSVWSAEDPAKSARECAWRRRRPPTRLCRRRPPTRRSPRSGGSTPTCRSNFPSHVSIATPSFFSSP